MDYPVTQTYFRFSDDYLAVVDYDMPSLTITRISVANPLSSTVIFDPEIKIIGFRSVGFGELNDLTKFYQHAKDARDLFQADRDE